MHHYGDSKGNVEKALVLISKTTTLHQRRTLRYISLLSLDNYDVKLTYVLLYGECKQTMAKFSFFLFPELGYGS